MEVGELNRCRLVALDLPDGLLPGPATGASAMSGNGVGVIVKPSLGLAPHEVAEVARAAVAGGAALIKDDETLGDPVWCRFEDRVAGQSKVSQGEVGKALLAVLRLRLRLRKDRSSSETRVSTSSACSTPLIRSASSTSTAAGGATG